MIFIPIDLADPLTLVRVWLTLVWSAAALYALWITLKVTRNSVWRVLAGFTGITSFLGAFSYFLGFSTRFTSISSYIAVAALLTFTPACLILWLHTSRNLNTETTKINEHVEELRTSIEEDQKDTMTEQHLVMGEQRDVMGEQRLAMQDPGEGVEQDDG